MNTQCGLISETVRLVEGREQLHLFQGVDIQAIGGDGPEGGRPGGRKGARAELCVTGPAFSKSLACWVSWGNVQRQESR